MLMSISASEDRSASSPALRICFGHAALHQLYRFVDAVRVAVVEHGKEPPHGLDWVRRCAQAVAVPASDGEHRTRVASLRGMQVPAQRFGVLVARGASPRSAADAALRIDHQGNARCIVPSVHVPGPTDHRLSAGEDREPTCPVEVAHSRIVHDGGSKARCRR
ncbi:hypothetical protein ACIA8J_33225 [Streptomyces asoensis]|uniref:hypothetical protein n=1 Tax=Streptomyces asoensis TaxID=249586 RepID=UPI00379EDE7E